MIKIDIDRVNKLFGYDGDDGDTQNDESTYTLPFWVDYRIETDEGSKREGREKNILGHVTITCINFGIRITKSLNLAIYILYLLLKFHQFLRFRLQYINLKVEHTRNPYLPFSSRIYICI